MAILGVRSHFEITGTIAFLYKRLVSFYKGNIDYDTLDRDLHVLSLGARVKEHVDMPDPIGVMDLIDAIDDYFRKLSGIKEKMFRTSYDHLSEFCHPNCFGLFMASEIDLESRIVHYHKPGNIQAENYWSVHLFLMSAESILNIYDKILDLIKKNEELPHLFF
ncbi:hypothetical protein H1230_16735 [Paenibacillus sp. 19GGS1-52]|uniref:hypothetical protein n=1 Tax=Paenibacillus sp. 19GGS1-52 TaxID=2758563 RepID=UPI001EFB6651|nr:hypothetical protein [Paenibacillus sp. 19GGS1-52]ULO04797.1 hypothetical protein H1230_16735 [Paenibacillus sp. 19GGS1-52]